MVFSVCTHCDMIWMSYGLWHKSRKKLRNKCQQRNDIISVIL